MNDALEKTLDEDVFAHLHASSALGAPLRHMHMRSGWLALLAIAGAGLFCWLAIWVVSGDSLTLDIAILRMVGDYRALPLKSLAPESFADYSYDAGSRFDESRFQGFSFEGIYRILSPYTDPIGLALYVEPTVGPNLRELESKAIVQKNFLDDRLVFAANLTLAQEMRWMKTDLNGSGEPASWDRETDLNLGIGVSYRFAPNWSAGIELEHEREYSSFHLSKKYRTNVATYLGPNIHYGGKDFFVTATFLTQVGGGKDYASDAGSSFVVGGRNYADDFEKDRLRIKAGYYF